MRTWVLALVGCGGGDAWRGAVVADGPPVLLQGDEVQLPFAITLRPVGVRDRETPLSFGFTATPRFSHPAEGAATVRTIVWVAEEGLVPTPWDAVVDESLSFPRESIAYSCGRGADECAVDAILGLEVRDGGVVDVTWDVEAWAYGPPGSRDRVAVQTSLDVVFGTPQ